MCVAIAPSSSLHRAIQLNRKVPSIASYIPLSSEYLLRIQPSIRNGKEENHTTEWANNEGDGGFYYWVLNFPQLVKWQGKKGRNCYQLSKELKVLNL